MRAAGATLGSGVVLVFDQTVDLVPVLLRIAAEAGTLGPHLRLLQAVGLQVRRGADLGQAVGREARAEDVRLSALEHEQHAVIGFRRTQTVDA